jgi:hypothetical protein
MWDFPFKGGNYNLNKATILKEFGILGVGVSATWSASYGLGTRIRDTRNILEE